jgi:hypothetical protein
MNNENLPIRFWKRAEQPDDFERYGSSLKSSEFVKIYNKFVNPYLKKVGFKTSGFKALKEDDNFYYMVWWGTDKWGRNGNVAMAVHPKGLPKLHGSSWQADTYKEVYNYLFLKDVLLPNGNEWINIGRNNDEAQETCNYILKGLEEQLLSFIAYFNNYPNELLNIDAHNFEAEYHRIYDKFGLHFNFKSKYDAARCLAIIHNANGSNGAPLAEIAKSEMLIRTAANGMTPNADFFEYIERLKAGKLI